MTTPLPLQQEPSSIRRLNFSAVGVPVPQGSMKGFVTPSTGKVVLTSTSGQKLKDWREIIYWSAYEACKEQDFALIEGPCAVTAAFTLPRPFSRPLKYKHPDKKPDLDKITRALLDGMTGVVYRDDAQVCSTNIVKKYPFGDERPGVSVIVTTL